jgi:hypothetical protein
VSGRWRNAELVPCCPVSSILSGPGSDCRPSRVHEKTCRYQAVAQVSERKTILTRGAQAMKSYQDAVIRLAEVPGLGVDSAQRIIAEAGAQASTFPSLARRKAINACAEC